MMRPNDPDAGQFSRLLDDLAALQDGRAFAKAMAAKPHRPSPRATVPHSYFTKAQGIADRRAADAKMNRTAADLSALERQVSDMAVNAAAENVGMRRARIRAAVHDVMQRAIDGVGKGEISAIEVAKLEGRAMRVLAAIEPGPTLGRGVA
ncbi:hypothetical protein [Neoroseomonas rubea]|uniref:hypothetical protein n=1 Tax=Neoroseomonas rubea TaxID=2748666 RepID=UPI0018DF88CB|nr:hypothetical protein [Roseomonas rubea]